MQVVEVERSKYLAVGAGAVDSVWSVAGKARARVRGGAGFARHFDGLSVVESGFEARMRDEGLEYGDGGTE